MPPSTPGRTGAAAVLGGTGLAFVGWSSLLVPSLIRSIEHDFGQSDAGIGVFFFVNALAYVTGSIAGGLLTERVGRRTILTLALLLMTIGLAGLASLPTWALVMVASVPFGLGSGGIDGGTNGLILDLYPSGRGRALNLLHLGFSLGALASPLAVGRLVEAGVAWQAIVLGSAIAAVVLAVLFATTPLPSGRQAAVGAGDGAEVGNGRPRVVFALPLIALGVAIACYVAAEVGVSNWLVRYLAAAPLGLATSALALFWGGLALGRLLSARLSDRFDHARFAAIASLVAAGALLGAVMVPSVPASIALFGAAGFAFGPIYPLIMAVGGDRFPGRAAAVSGFLSGVAIIGAVAYPPVMGFLSVTVGLGVAMGGAAVLALVCSGVLYLVGRAPDPIVQPEPA
jgi:MFS transporter, OFA family, oxalate/formate antiporter